MAGGPGIITGLEPEVQAFVNAHGLRLTAGDVASMSMAISLRRIADALTGDGDNIFTKPINSYGEGIGDAIQGQMVRGAAGISQYDR